MDASICNNKQCWKDDKCRCECKELIDKGVCDRGYSWNPSNCECECDKSCGVAEYLDYENCKCRKRLVDKLVEECGENVDEAKLAGVTLFEHENEYVCFYCLGCNSINSQHWDRRFFTYKYIKRNKENVSIYDYVYHAKNY